MGQTGDHRRRRRGFLALAILAAWPWPVPWPQAPCTLVHAGRERVPSASSLSPLRARIVSIAESQIGYKTDPPGTYCNKYSAYWYSGSADCGNDNLDEEWCADFAAWVWKQAGARSTTST